MDENFNTTIEPAATSLNITRWQVHPDIYGPAIALLVAIEFVIAVPSNTFILAHSFYYRSKILKKSSTLLFFNLALSELLISIGYMPFVIVAASAGEWIFGSTDYTRDVLCQISGFFVIFVGHVANYTIAAVSVDRWLSITYPRVHRKYMTWKTALGIIAFIWVINIFQNLTPYYGSGLGSYTWVNSLAACITIWTDTDYVIFLMVVNIICVSVIVIPTIWTFLFTRGFIKKDLKRHKNTLSKDGLKAQKHIYSNKFKSLIGIFGTLLIFNTLAWTPLILTGLSSIIVGFNNVPVQLYATTFVLFLTNNVSSPIIQSYFRKDLHNCLKKILYRVFANRSITAESVSQSKQRQSTNTIDRLDVEKQENQPSKNNLSRPNSIDMLETSLNPVTTNGDKIMESKASLAIDVGTNNHPVSV